MSRTVAIVLSILAIASTSAHAMPFDLYGSSPKSAAMGNAIGSLAMGADAAHLNPASLTNGEDWVFRLEVGYFLVRPSIEYALNGPNPSLDPDVVGEEAFGRAAADIAAGGTTNDVSGWNAGIFVKPAERFAVGLSLHVPQHRIVDSLYRDFSEPFFLQYDERGQQLVLRPAFAVKVWEGLSVGAAAHFLVDSSGDTYGRVPFGTDGTVDIRLGFGLYIDTTFSYGINWASDNWGIGVSMRDEQRLTFSGEQVFQTNIGATRFNIPISIRGYSLFNPRTFQLSSHVDATDQLTVAAAVSWVQWSDYVPPYLRTRVDFPENLNPSLYPEVLDRADPRIAPFWEFDDIFVPHVGLEYRFREEWAVRVGYEFEADPVPEQTGITNIISGDTHVIGFGLSYDQDQRFFFDIFAQYRIMTDVSVSKADALLLDQSLDPGLQSANPGYPGVDASASSIAFGVSMTVQ